MNNHSSNSKSKEMDDKDVEFERLFNALILSEPISTGGRSTKCNKEMTETIALLLSKGSTIKDACKLVGIHVQSYYNWIERGRKEFKRLYDPSENTGNSTNVLQSEQPYLYFFEVTQKSIPFRKMMLLGRIEDAGTKARHWTANAWLLEREHPEQFGKRSKLQIADWRYELIQEIKKGNLTFEMLLAELGKNESEKLFIAAGMGIPAARKSTTINPDK